MNCSSCCRPAETPYRHHDKAGRVTEGCVNDCHTPHLQGLTTESAKWHFRREAVNLRKRAAQRIKDLVKS